MKTDEVIALLAADHEAARRESARARRQSLALIAGAVLLSALLFALLLGARPDLWANGVIAAILRKESVTVAAALTGLAMAWSLSRPTQTQTAGWTAPAALLAGLVIWELAVAGVGGWQTRMIGRNGLACLVTIPFLALAPLAALLAALRHRAPARPGFAGGAAGFAASGIGATIYALHCTDDSMLFVAFWYLCATAVLVTIGAMAGRRMLRW